MEIISWDNEHHYKPLHPETIPWKSIVWIEGGDIIDLNPFQKYQVDIILLKSQDDQNAIFAYNHGKVKHIKNLI